MVKWAAFLFLLAGVTSAACVGGERGSLPPPPEDGAPPTVGGREAPPATGVAPQITVRTDRDTYRDGESVVVTVANDSSSPIQFVNGCSLNLCYESGGGWICAERECEGPMTAVEPGSFVDIVKEAQSLDPSEATDLTSRYRLDYYSAPDNAYHFTHSNVFTVASGGASCKPARQIALEHVRESTYWERIDASRAIVRWHSERRACVVDFAWQGAGQILPGMWSEGYYVVVGARFGWVIEANAYVR